MSAGEPDLRDPPGTRLLAGNVEAKRVERPALVTSSDKACLATCTPRASSALRNEIGQMAQSMTDRSSATGTP